MGEEKRTLSCTDCGVLNCHKRNASYPEFCLTEKLTDEDIAETTALYEDEENRKVSVISAEIEGEFYGKYTRVDEIIEFAKRMGYKKIGIATCVGLIEESRIFAKILRKNGFDVYSAVCKVGSFNKTDIGLDEKYTCVTGNVMCNPILQAKLLNKAGTDLNVVIGLCVDMTVCFISIQKRCQQRWLQRTVCSHIIRLAHCIRLKRTISDYWMIKEN